MIYVTVKCLYILCLEIRGFATINLLNNYLDGYVLGSTVLATRYTEIKKKKKMAPV